MQEKTAYADLEQRIVELERLLNEKDAENAMLKRNTIFLKSLIQTIPDPVWMKNEEGTYVFCNLRFEKLVGATEKNIINKTDFDLFEKSIAESYRIHDQKVVANRCPGINEEEVTYVNDGHHEILQTIKAPVYKNDGSVLGVLGIGRDITEFKHNEKDIIETKKRLRSFMDAATDEVMAIFDQELRIIDINKWGLDTIDSTLKQKDVIGKDITDIIPFLKNNTFYQQYKNVLETGVSLVFEECMEVAKIKSWFIFRIFKVGNDLGLMLTDISKIKKAQEETRKTKELLQLFMNSAPVSMAVYDKNLRLIEINDIALKRYSKPYTTNDLIGKHLYEIVSLLDDISFFKQFNEKIKGDKPFFDETILTGNGGKSWNSIRAFRVGDGLGLIAIDITAQRRAELEAKEVSERLQTFIDSATDLIALTDSDGQLININKRILDYFPGGTRKEDIIGKSLISLGGDFVTKDILSKLAEVKTNKKPAMFNKEFVVNEKHYWYNIRFFSVGDKIGIIVNDITEIKLLEQQLYQSQKIESIGRLAGGVAHDFNNMLGIIIGYTDLILSETDPKSETFSPLQNIVDAAKRSAELTGQLLAFSRKQAVVPTAMSINSTIESMLKMLGTLIGEHVQIIWKPDSTVSTILFDYTQFNQILTNLCINARDAIENSGRITIETGFAELDKAYCSYNNDCQPGKYTVLTVSDNGKGMSKDVIKNVFEPFFTTKEVGKGTGLGLATVYGIVKQNNGNITIYSEPGLGTTFKIFFPEYDTETQGVRKSDEVILPKRGTATILLVEDEMSILDLSRTILEKYGYTVIPSNDPIEALRIAETYNDGIDLLISDVIMPGMNGKALYDNVKKLYNSIKCLFMSGYTDDLISHHGLLSLETHFIQKPFTVNKFVIEVNRLLDSD